MTFSIHGLAVARGIAVGRAVLVASSRVDVAHYFIQPDQVTSEIERVVHARECVIEEINKLQQTLPKDAPPELAALLDVHMMLLQDEMLTSGINTWVRERFYNAEWALTSQLEVVARQFDEMEDPYLRERKGDLEQVVERLLRHLKGDHSGLPQRGSREANELTQQPDLLAGEQLDVPLILVAHDLSPADLLQFKQSVFTGFVTDVGGKTSHTAIVAKSLDIPAVVGARTASHLIRQDDWIIVDGDAGVVIVDPSPIILDEYSFKQRQAKVDRERLSRLRHRPASTLDDQPVELLANIEMPEDTKTALSVGAVGVGLFRSEFLFMGRDGQLPDEEEQYKAYCAAVDGMNGLPVTIRTVDVGADKSLDRSKDEAHLNPALGLRAIRWSLSEPGMFLTQLRAILRAAAKGQVNLLIPMLAHAREIQQTLALLETARHQLDAKGAVYGPLKIGAMIEIPAAAISVRMFLKYFDFLSIGTNDLIQYTLAIDRADEQVAHLYDPLHPALLRLVADTIAACNEVGKSVCVCGEMAGDSSMTKLLLGLGLRSFSMHPTQILSVKQEILRADTQVLRKWAQEVIHSDDPAQLMEQFNRSKS